MIFKKNYRVLFPIVLFVISTLSCFDNSINTCKKEKKILFDEICEKKIDSLLLSSDSILIIRREYDTGFESVCIIWQDTDSLSVICGQVNTSKRIIFTEKKYLKENVIFNNLVSHIGSTIETDTSSIPIPTISHSSYYRLNIYTKNKVFKYGVNSSVVTYFDIYKKDSSPLVMSDIIVLTGYFDKYKQSEMLSM